jgi:hypothetical protein
MKTNKQRLGSPRLIKLSKETLRLLTGSTSTTQVSPPDPPVFSTTPGSYCAGGSWTHPVV